MQAAIIKTTERAITVELSDKAKRYARKSRADNTLRTYKAAWAEFEHYAAQQGEPAMPAGPGTVIEYIVALAEAGAKVSTISVKLAAIAWAHRAHAQPDPTVYEAVRAVMAGIRRDKRIAPQKKAPVTLDELRAMVGTLDPSTPAGKRDRALLLVGFAGAFRRSELVALDVADVRLNGTLKITVRQSKTDQDGAGMVKTIPAIDDPDLDPATAMRAWLDASGIKSGAVFRQIDRWGNLRESRLTSQSVALVVKNAAKRAGLDWRAFSGHSLRSGFITEAAGAGVESRDIMSQTGHKSEAVMRGYIQDAGKGASRAVRAAFGQGDAPANRGRGG